LVKGMLDDFLKQNGVVSLEKILEGYLAKVYVTEFKYFFALREFDVF